MDRDQSGKHANNAVCAGSTKRTRFHGANRRTRFIDPSRHPSTRTKSDETKASLSRPSALFLDDRILFTDRSCAREKNRETNRQATSMTFFPVHSNRSMHFDQDRRRNLKLESSDLERTKFGRNGKFLDLFSSNRTTLLKNRQQNFDN